MRVRRHRCAGRRAEDLLSSTPRQIALYDALTGLPNRTQFLQRLDAACRRHDRPEQFALLFLDLDDFKAVNDTHGHAMGDAVLRETAAALSGRLRAGDLIARLGGDEFVVLLESLRHGSTDMPAIAQGVVASSLLAAADAAMYRNKRARRRKAAGNPPASPVVSEAL